ncbi:MAG TPA: hypothetical protein VHB50_06390, partial [Bryobacteraceae bacterium]|nr:hypothetical protein [Bryobacteraceae bacterium]
MTRTIKTSFRRYRYRTASTLLLICGVSAAVPVLPAAISIDFAGTGTAMGATETAGVVAKSNWNVASGASSATPLKLKDDTGALTNTTVSWKADNGWATPVTDQAGNYRMMKGYLDNGSGNPTTVTLSGLSSGKYDIYVYTDGDNATYSHSGVYQLSGSGITT